MEPNRLPASGVGEDTVRHVEIPFGKKKTVNCERSGQDCDSQPGSSGRLTTKKLRCPVTPQLSSLQHRVKASLLSGFFFSGLFFSTFRWLFFATFSGLFFSTFSWLFLATFTFVVTARSVCFVIGICCRSVRWSVICSATAADYCKSHQHGTQHRQKSLHSEFLKEINGRKTQREGLYQQGLSNLTSGGEKIPSAGCLFPEHERFSRESRRPVRVTQASSKPLFRRILFPRKQFRLRIRICHKRKRAG